MVTVPLQSFVYPDHLAKAKGRSVSRLAFRKINWETKGLSYFYISFRNCSAHCSGIVDFVEEKPRNIKSESKKRETVFGLLFDN